MGILRQNVPILILFSHFGEILHQKKTLVDGWLFDIVNNLQIKSYGNMKNQRTSSFFRPLKEPTVFMEEFAKEPIVYKRLFDGYLLKLWFFDLLRIMFMY